MRKMFIFSNLATSLDGKIATTSRALYPLGTAEDRRHMQRLRSRSDVVLFGAESLRAFRRPCIVTGPEAGNIVQQPANAIVSSRMEAISPSWPFFKNTGFHRILIVGAQTPAATLRKFERTCEIVTLNRPTRQNTTACQSITALRERGYRKLLIEGGGQVMWDFVQDNWIDEYHVTLTPKLIGGIDAPTLVDGIGLKPNQVVNLKLHACSQIADELYLIYRRRSRRG